jgi:hypothetical protein
LVVGDITLRDARLARRPLEREPEALRTKVARWRDRLRADHPRQILAEADDEAIARRLRRRGTEEQRRQRSHDGQPTKLHEPPI